jgi:hypothetical protein
VTLRQAQDKGYAADRAEIADLMARYLFAMDYADPAAYAACFTEDGVLDYAAGVTQGRDAIRTEAAQFRDAIARVFVREDGTPARLRHLVQHKALRVEGDRAWHTGLWWEMTDGGPGGALKAQSFGTYEDELRRVEGRWLFARRKIYNEFLAGRESGSDNPVLKMDAAA